MTKLRFRGNLRLSEIMWYVAILMNMLNAKTPQSKKMVFYVDLEHANLTYWNPKYYEYVNFTTQRYSRRDPIHYMNAHSKTLVAFGNDVMFDLYIYEFLSNEYRRSFIEVHYKLCDLMVMEKNFLPAVMKFLPIKVCPFKKAEYHFVNVSMPELAIFRTFPFNRGRIFINTTLWRTGERLLDGYADMTIKQRFQ